MMTSQLLHYDIKYYTGENGGSFHNILKGDSGMVLVNMNDS